MVKEIKAPICVSVNGCFIEGISEERLPKFIKKIEKLRKKNLIRLKAYVDKTINKVRSVRLEILEGEGNTVKRFCLRHRRKIA